MSYIARKKYLISAIVSLYNSEKFIVGKIEDLLSQTISSEIEIIFVDSNSQQNEQQIITQYQKKHNNITYLRTGYRESVYQAWNRGIKLSSGIYITNANTDDRLRQNAIEQLVNLLENNKDKVLAYGDSIVTLFENETFEQCTPHSYLCWPDFDRKKMLDYCFIGPHPVWRKKIHEELGFFNEKYQCAADYDFWLRIALKHDFIHLQEFIGLYWLNEQTVSRKGNLPIQEAFEIKEKYFKIYNKILK